MNIIYIECKWNYKFKIYVTSKTRLNRISDELNIRNNIRTN